MLLKINMKEYPIFIITSMGFFFITIISKLFESTSHFQISFFIEILGLIIICLNFIMLYFKTNTDLTKNAFGLSQNAFIALLVITLLTSLPWWFTECVNLFNMTFYRRAFATYSFSTLIKAPIFEEIYFRGILLWFLRKNSTDTKSALISSSLFSLIHIPLLIVDLSVFSVVILVGTFLFGYLLCLIQISKNNLLIPILIHLMLNISIILLGIDPIISNPICS